MAHGFQNVTNDVRGCIGVETGFIFIEMKPSAWSALVSKSKNRRAALHAFKILQISSFEKTCLQLFCSRRISAFPSIFFKLFSSYHVFLGSK